MNYHIFEIINGWAGRSDGLDDLMEFLATTLIYAIFALTALLCGYALYRRRIRAVVLTAVALALAFAAALVTSHLSHEVRPFQSHRVVQLIPHEAGVALPSDHATAAFTMAFAIGVFVHRGWAIVLAVAAAAIGFGRVWVGVHYPGDIAAAVLIAVAAVAVTAAADRYLRRAAAVPTS